MDAIKLFHVKDLRLDPENPRLPEEVRGRSQSEILAYLFRNDVLEELAESLADSAFFRTNRSSCIEIARRASSPSSKGTVDLPR